EIAPNPPAEGEAPGDATFTVNVRRGGRVEETFGDLTRKRGKQNVATIVNAQSQLIRIEEVTSSLPDQVGQGSIALAGGGVPEVTSVNADDYVGDSADRTGFGGLQAIDNITMVCVPDLMAAYQAGMIDLEGVQAVQLGMIAHCELMGDRMAILDAPPGLNAQQVLEWRVGKAGYDSRFAALYWPWGKGFDPSTRQNGFLPPRRHQARVLG